jgi:hypothetical protein
LREDLAQGQRLGDECDDAHLGATLRAQQWEYLIDARQQQGPGVSRCPAMERLLCCVCRLN